jgi:hypothetical protein
VITERDLDEGIAECQGQRNPNANTCLKLAAFLTIKKELFGRDADVPAGAYSGSAPPLSMSNTVEYKSDTEFAQAIRGMDTNKVMALMDELMTTLATLSPRLYAGVMQRIAE